MAGDPDLSLKSAFAMGLDLRGVGINMNLAPVVDVNSSPRHSAIGIRSFGSSPEEVILYAKPALQGFRDAGVLSCLKHFPGLGGVEEDSHFTLPCLNRTKEEMAITELLPFKELASQSDAIMTAHIMVPHIDPLNCATLSPKILGILRNDIDFKGVIISDSLIMQGVLHKNGQIEEIALEALNAGCDLLLLGGRQLQTGGNQELTLDDIRRIHKFLIQAVAEKRLSEEKVNQSVARILALKNRLAAYEPLACEEPQIIAQEIANKAIQVHRQKQLPPFKERRLAFFAPKQMQEVLEKTTLLQLSKHVTPFYFSSLNPQKEEIQAATAHAKEAEILLTFCYSIGKNDGQKALIESLEQTNKPLILCSMTDPIEALSSNASLILNTFSPTLFSIQAACERLIEEDIHSLFLGQAASLANQIWKNECGGTIAGLTHWNKNENFASLGLGHFIWYPKNTPKVFEETFPHLLKFIEQQGSEIPLWLKNSEGSPWQSREEFYQNIQSSKMEELRQFLFKTKDLQALFLSLRAENSLLKMEPFLNQDEKMRIKDLFYTLAREAKGLYALIDYINFKGIGTSPNETYNGQGWGLLQVLRDIPPHSTTLLEDFVESAKKLLTERVENSPSSREEKNWLAGWLHRLETYIVD